MIIEKWVIFIKTNFIPIFCEKPIEGQLKSFLIFIDKPEWDSHPLLSTQPAVLSKNGKQFLYPGLLILSPSLKGLSCFPNCNCYKKTGYEL